MEPAEISLLLLRHLARDGCVETIRTYVTECPAVMQSLTVKGGGDVPDMEFFRQKLLNRSVNMSLTDLLSEYGRAKSMIQDLVSKLLFDWKALTPYFLSPHDSMATQLAHITNLLESKCKPLRTDWKCVGTDGEFFVKKFGHVGLDVGVQTEEEVEPMDIPEEPSDLPTIVSSFLDPPMIEKIVELANKEKLKSSQSESMLANDTESEIDKMLVDILHGIGGNSISSNALNAGCNSEDSAPADQVSVDPQLMDLFQYAQNTIVNTPVPGTIGTLARPEDSVTKQNPCTSFLDLIDTPFKSAFMSNPNTPMGKVIKNTEPEKHPEKPIQTVELNFGPTTTTGQLPERTSAKQNFMPKPKSGPKFSVVPASDKTNIKVLTGSREIQRPRRKRDITPRIPPTPRLPCNEGANPNSASKRKLTTPIKLSPVKALLAPTVNFYCPSSMEKSKTETVGGETPCKQPVPEFSSLTTPIPVTETSIAVVNLDVSVNQPPLTTINYQDLGSNQNLKNSDAPPKIEVTKLPITSEIIIASEKLLTPDLICNEKFEENVGASPTPMYTRLLNSVRNARPSSMLLRQKSFSTPRKKGHIRNLIFKTPPSAHSERTENSSAMETSGKRKASPSPPLGNKSRKQLKWNNTIEDFKNASASFNESLVQPQTDVNPTSQIMADIAGKIVGQSAVNTRRRSTRNSQGTQPQKSTRQTRGDSSKRNEQVPKKSDLIVLGSSIASPVVKPPGASMFSPVATSGVSHSGTSISSPAQVSGILPLLSPSGSSVSPPTETSIISPAETSPGVSVTSPLVTSPILPTGSSIISPSGVSANPTQGAPVRSPMKIVSTPVQPMVSPAVKSTPSPTSIFSPRLANKISPVAAPPVGGSSRRSSKRLDDQRAADAAVISAIPLGVRNPPVTRIRITRGTCKIESNDRVVQNTDDPSSSTYVKNDAIPAPMCFGDSSNIKETTVQRPSARVEKLRTEPNNQDISKGVTNQAGPEIIIEPSKEVTPDSANKRNRLRKSSVENQVKSASNTKEVDRKEFNPSQASVLDQVTSPLIQTSGVTVGIKGNSAVERKELKKPKQNPFPNLLVGLNSTRETSAPEIPPTTPTSNDSNRDSKSVPRRTPSSPPKGRLRSPKKSPGKKRILPKPVPADHPRPVFPPTNQNPGYVLSIPSASPAKDSDDSLLKSFVSPATLPEISEATLQRTGLTLTSSDSSLEFTPSIPATPRMRNDLDDTTSRMFLSIRNESMSVGAGIPIFSSTPVKFPPETPGKNLPLINEGDSSTRTSLFDTPIKAPTPPPNSLAISIDTVPTKSVQFATISSSQPDIIRKSPRKSSSPLKVRAKTPRKAKTPMKSVQKLTISPAKPTFEFKPTRRTPYKSPLSKKQPQNSESKDNTDNKNSKTEKAMYFQSPASSKPEPKTPMASFNTLNAKSRSLMRLSEVARRGKYSVIASSPVVKTSSGSATSVPLKEVTPENASKSDVNFQFAVSGRAKQLSLSEHESLIGLLQIGSVKSSSQQKKPPRVVPKLENTDVLSTIDLHKFLRTVHAGD